MMYGTPPIALSNAHIRIQLCMKNMIHICDSRALSISTYKLRFTPRVCDSLIGSKAHLMISSQSSNRIAQGVRHKYKGKSCD